MQTEISNNDWRDEVSGTPLATFKIADGETKQFVFLDEGKRVNHADFSPAIVFKVNHEGEEMSWYVNAQNFDLLGQIKELGKLEGLKAVVHRTGSTKSNTRYQIKKFDGEFKEEVVKAE